MTNAIPAARMQLADEASRQFAAMPRLDGSVSDVITVDIADDLIQAVRIVRNPEKLRHLG